MARYLDPKNDLTFKRIFGEYPNLLINFLNAVMPFPPDRFIETITYLPSEMIPDNPTRKNSLVDVRCVDNQKRRFIVEMQMYWDGAFTNLKHAHTLPKEMRENEEISQAAELCEEGAFTPAELAAYEKYRDIIGTEKYPSKILKGFWKTICPDINVSAKTIYPYKR